MRPAWSKLSRGMVMATAETTTGTSGSSTDHSRGLKTRPVNDDLVGKVGDELLGERVFLTQPLRIRQTHLRPAVASNVCTIVDSSPNNR